MDDLDEATEKSDKSLKSFGESAKKTGKIVAGVGAAVIAAGTALSSMIITTAMNRRELELLSKQAKLSVDDFAALAFATKQFGLEAEQIADISKDISDKLGEFAKAGTGPFQDFVDVMGMTKEEGQVLAIQMQDLSSDQVIGHLVSQMEKAGASGNEMTFVLESMGNDLSRLVPLFANNSKELDNLQGAFKAATKEMELTEEQAKDLEGAAKSFDLLMASLGSAATNIAANIAPSIENFFQGIIESVPNATKAINEFLDQIEHPSMRKSFNVVQSGTIQRDSDGNVTGSTDTTNRIAEATAEKVGAVRTEQDILSEVRANARAIEKEAFDAQNAAAIESIRERGLTEIELLQEKLEEELAIVAGNDELTLQLKEAHAKALVDIELDAQAEIDKAKAKQDKLKERQAKDEVRQAKKDSQDRVKIEQSFLNAAKSLNSDLLEDNKLVGAGIIVADTSIGVMKAYSQLGAWGTPAALAIAANGLTQLGNLEGAGRGGGSTASPSAIPTDIPEQDQSELLLSQSDTNGANQSVIIRFEGSGDEITEALAKNMKVLQRNGTIEA